MGFYYAVPLLGPSVGPLIGGALTSAYSWRSTFYFIAALGGISLVRLLSPSPPPPSLSTMPSLMNPKYASTTGVLLLLSGHVAQRALARVPDRAQAIRRGRASTPDPQGGEAPSQGC